jgi:hypothetical protein
MIRGYGLIQAIERIYDNSLWRLALDGRGLAASGNRLVAGPTFAECF